MVCEKGKEEIDDPRAERDDYKAYYDAMYGPTHTLDALEEAKARIEARREAERKRLKRKA